MNPYFESRAEKYAEKSETGLWNRFRKMEYSVVSDLLGSSSGQTIADLGCGAGYYANLLKNKLQLEVLGVDSSPSMLEHLKRMGIKTVLSPIEDLKIEDKFDLALVAGALEFISRPDLVFKKCREILKPNARLVILIPNDGVLGSLYRRFHEFQDCPTYLRSREQYQAMAKLKGFVFERAQSCSPISQAMSFRSPSA